MVAHVIQDFRKAVLADVDDVLRYIFDTWKDAESPYSVFRHVITRRDFKIQIDYVVEAIRSRTCLAIGFQQTIIDKRSDIAIYRLARQVKFFCGQWADIIGVLCNIPKNELSYRRILPAGSGFCQF